MRAGTITQRYNELSCESGQGDATHTISEVKFGQNTAPLKFHTKYKRKLLAIQNTTQIKRKLQKQNIRALQEF